MICGCGQCKVGDSDDHSGISGSSVHKKTALRSYLKAANQRRWQRRKQEPAEGIVTVLVTDYLVSVFGYAGIQDRLYRNGEVADRL